MKPLPSRHRLLRRSPLARTLAAIPLVLATGLLMASSNGAWLHRVSPTDHARLNPLATNPESRDHAAAAGRQLFYNECAKCHGNDGGGLHGRPPVISDRIDHTTDGDLFWLMTNGNPWRGMPPWMMLPAGERWQLVTYLRALNLAEDAGATPTAAAVPQPQAAPTPGARQ